MRQYVPEVLLWLFVINLGIALGAGIYEQRIVISQWQDIPPQEWPNTGLQFWVYVTTVPLTLLTLANLVAAWMDRGPRRYWWLGAAAIIVVERVATFAYFVPTMVWLQGIEGLPKAVREIAWKAQLRLCGRYRKLMARGKRQGVVTAAIAREMAAFLWAIGREVEPRHAG